MRNRLMAALASRFPSAARASAEGYRPQETLGVPWAPLSKPLSGSAIAVVTTAGVHHRDQEPFDMGDPDGDPSWRLIDASRPRDSLVITHDYYDHADADRDINIVFPIDRLGEFSREGLLGRIVGMHYGFMGHITGRHIRTLTERSAPEVASAIRRGGADAVLLLPG